MGGERSHDQADLLADLRAALRALEERVARVEAALPAGARGPDPRASASGERASLGPEGPQGTAELDLPQVVPLLGRLLLVLAGAYLLRATTEGGPVPPWLGAGLGLLYAWSWVGASHRAALGGRRLSAAFHGGAAALVAYPLLWEATARFQLLSPATAAVALAATTLAGLSVAARHRLEPLAWIFGGGASATGALLLVGPGGAVPFAACFVLLGLAALLLGRARGWTLFPWAAALVADAAVVFLTTVVLGGRTPVQLPLVVAIQLALPALDLAAIGFGLVRGGRPLTAFDVVQSCVALAVGYLGASAVAGPGGAALLGLGGLGAGIGAYALAFGAIARERRAQFLYVSTLAWVLVLLGSASLLDRPALPWALLALALAWAAGHTGRVTLRLHAVLCAFAATCASGLLRLAANAWVGSPTAPWPELDAVRWVTLGVAAACAMLAPLRADPWWRRLHVLPGVFAAALGLVVGGGAIVALAVGPIAGTPGRGADPALVAVVRTAVLALAGLLCALAARTRRLEAGAWLVVPLLALGLAKLLIEDLPHGRPSTLWLSLLLYGTVLILGPRWARRTRGSSEGPKASAA